MAIGDFGRVSEYPHINQFTRCSGSLSFSDGNCSYRQATEEENSTIQKKNLVTMASGFNSQQPQSFKQPTFTPGGPAFGDVPPQFPGQAPQFPGGNQAPQLPGGVPGGNQQAPQFPGGNQAPQFPGGGQPPNQFKNQCNDRRTIDLLLSERKAWASSFVQEYRYTKCGISPEYIQARMASRDISEDAIKYIIDYVNQMLLSLLTKARDNGVHRRAMQIEAKDVVMATNSISIFKSLATKDEILPFNEPVRLTRLCVGF